MRYLQIIFSVLLLAIFSISDAEATELTVVYSGESHAMIYPCSCPKSPDGGLARRATLIKNVRQNKDHVLVLDGGGFAAGGRLDQYTKGRKIDLERTLTNIAGMGLIGYDAAVFGDDELLFAPHQIKAAAAEHKLPLLSANISYKGDPFLAPYLIKNIAGLKVAIIGLSPDRYKLTPGAKARVQEFGVESPVVALRKTMQEVGQEVDQVFVISHLGESASLDLLESVKGVDVLFVGHQRSSPGNATRYNETIIVQFNYQAKKVISLDLTIKDRKVERWKYQTLAAERSVPDAPEIVKLLKQHESRIAGLDRRVTVDLHIMMLCPVGQQAVKDLESVRKLFGSRVKVNTYFIGGQGPDGRLLSQRGEPEIEEALVAVLIREQDKAQLTSYLMQRFLDMSKKLPWRDTVTKLGYDLAQIESQMKQGLARAMLIKDFERTKRFRIDGSPFVQLNNVEFRGQNSIISYQLELCALLNSGKDTKPADRIAPCRQLPECVDSNDCYKKGYDSECLRAGSVAASCAHTIAPKMDFYVLTDSRELAAEDQMIVGATERIFPGATIHRVDRDSSEGERYLRLFNPSVLPIYFFSKEVAAAAHFTKAVAPVADKVSDHYLLRPHAVGANFYLNRKFVPGKVDLVISTFNKTANRVLRDTYSIIKTKNLSLDVYYFLTTDAQGVITGSQGKFEVEEAVRRMVIAAGFSDKYLDYIALRYENLTTSYWEDIARAAGLDPEEIELRSRGQIGQDLLARNQQFLRSTNLALQQNYIFLLNNTESVVVRSVDKFELLVDKLAKSRK